MQCAIHKPLANTPTVSEFTLDRSENIFLTEIFNILTMLLTYVNFTTGAIMPLYCLGIYRWELKLAPAESLIKVLYISFINFFIDNYSIPRILQNNFNFFIDN